jgi:hypothetical protein
VPALRERGLLKYSSISSLSCWSSSSEELEADDEQVEEAEEEEEGVR